MVFQFYFKKMQSSDFLKSLSQKKFTEIIERFVGQTGLVRITFLSEKNEQKIDCHLQGWNGTVLHASGTSDNMYATIDVVAQKLEAQLMRHKMKTRRQSRLPNARHHRLQLIQENVDPRSQDPWFEESETSWVGDYRIMN